MMNILLPTDFSDNAKSATDFALSLFDPAKVRLVLFHSVVPPRTTPGMMINISNLIQEDAKKDLTIEKHRIEAKFPDVHEIITVAKQGYLQDLVPALCSAHHIHLIVMGTKGETNLAAKVMGSNTESILRRGFAPLMAVPPVELTKGRLEVVIATGKEAIPHEEDIWSLFQSLKDRTRVHFQVLQVLLSADDKAPKSMKFGSMQIAVRVESANTPPEGIYKYLNSHKTDLLVLCHRNTTRIDYLLSRSTTKRLTSAIETPLLIYPNSETA